MGCSSSIKVKSKSPPTDASKGETEDQKEGNGLEDQTLLEVERIHAEQVPPTASQEGRQQLPEAPDERDGDGDGERES